MFCCSNCFADSEIKAIINGNKVDGDCDFCGSRNIRVYEIGGDPTLTELFDGLLDVYSPVSELPEDFPSKQTGMMKDILSHNWRIFNNNNLEPDKIHQLITEICSDRYRAQPVLFDNPVGIRQSQDSEYLEENSILKNNRWDDFVTGIKRKNRFHSDFINKDKLYLFLKCAGKTYRQGEVLYRSRICPNQQGFPKEEMGPPPVDKAKGGRVNPIGISILYLSDSRDTTLYEIRAGIYDFVTVGRFELQKNIEVINLASIDHISPFIGVDYGFDYTQYALNMEHLKMIAQEIAKPLRNDNALDYLPTQYISDYIRSKGYDGIEYISTMCEKGSNLAIFDPSLFECTDTSVCEVKSIFYSCDPV